MTTTLFLVRHGAHDRLNRILCGRMPGVTLSEEGRAQARRTGERLAREPIMAVQTSPLERARETADAIGAEIGRDVEVSEALNELEVGVWAGLSFEALKEDPAWRSWNEVRAVSRPPGGETMLEAQARIIRHIEALRERCRDGAVVLVSHGDVIKAALAYHLGLPLDFISRFEVGPASVSTLIVGDWGAKVLSINESVAS